MSWRNSPTSAGQAQLILAQRIEHLGVRAQLGAHLGDVAVRASGQDPRRAGIRGRQRDLRDLLTQPFQLPLDNPARGLRTTPVSSHLGTRDGDGFLAREQLVPRGSAAPRHDVIVTPPGQIPTHVHVCTCVTNP